MKSANHVQTCWSKFSSSRTFVYHQYNCCTLSCKHPRLSPPWLHSMRTKKGNAMVENVKIMMDRLQINCKLAPFGNMYAVQAFTTCHMHITRQPGVDCTCHKLVCKPCEHSTSGFRSFPAIVCTVFGRPLQPMRNRCPCASG